MKWEITDHDGNNSIVKTDHLGNIIIEQSACDVNDHLDQKVVITPQLRRLFTISFNQMVNLVESREHCMANIDSVVA